MYEAFFGLDHAPFSLTPDTERFVSLDSHAACFEVLRFALESNEGFVKVIGDVGTGKTLLSRKLLHYLQDANRYLPIYIPNPMLSALGLMRAIASALRIESAATMRYADLFECIQQRLLEEIESDRSAVIIIDEAQALPEDTLEALRLITNLETETRKLVQIVLFGQPELDVVLNQHRFRQLRQRIAFHARLDPMNASHVGHYVQARLQASGYSGGPVFTPGALKRLYRHSRGVPRMLNILCHKALLSAYARGQRLVTPRDIRRAAADTPAAAGTRPWRWPLLGLIPLMLVAAVLVYLNLDGTGVLPWGAEP